MQGVPLESCSQGANSVELSSTVKDQLYHILSSRESTQAHYDKILSLLASCLHSEFGGAVACSLFIGEFPFLNCVAWCGSEAPSSFQIAECLSDLGLVTAQCSCQQAKVDFLSSHNHPELSFEAIEASALLRFFSGKKLVGVLVVSSMELSIFHSPSQIQKLLTIGDQLQGALSRAAEFETAKKKLERAEVALMGAKLGSWDFELESREFRFDSQLHSMLATNSNDPFLSLDQFYNLIHTDDRSLAERLLNGCLSGLSEGYNLELRCKDSTAQWRWYLASAKLVRTSVGSGKPRVFGSFRDIHTQKLNEIEMQRAQQALLTERQLFMDGKVVVFKWANQEGWPIEYVSANVKDQLGYSAEDWLSGKMKYSDAVHPEDMAQVSQEVEMALAGTSNSFTHEDYRFYHKDGNVLWLHDHSTLLRNEKGEVTHFLGYVYDVTERREGEKMRQALEAQVLQTSKQKSLGVLAGGIAHDFNNLLVGVLGNVDLARSQMGDANENLNYIEIAARRAAELVQQLLSYSGKTKPLSEELNLNLVVDEMLHLLNLANSKKIDIELNLSKDSVILKADASQLRQVVMNIITNAFESIDNQDGKVSLFTGVMHCSREFLSSTYVDDNLAEADYVFLEVCDTGVGMDQKTLSRMFDPFYSTKANGRGLGLASVLGIVRSHGGALHIHSSPGQGTCFTVVFPQAKKQKIELTNSQFVAARRSPKDCLKGQTVLLVDDEHIVSEVAKVMLERMGASVEVACDGVEALEIYSADPARFNLVLLDLTMPRMNGEECFKKLKELNDEVVAVLCSGYGESEILDRFKSMGLSAFVQKPFDYKSLQEAVQSLELQSSN